MTKYYQVKLCLGMSEKDSFKDKVGSVLELLWDEDVAITQEEAAEYITGHFTGTHKEGMYTEKQKNWFFEYFQNLIRSNSKGNATDHKKATDLINLGLQCESTKAKINTFCTEELSIKEFCGKHAITLASLGDEENQNLNVLGNGGDDSGYCRE